ncbi:MAG: hypothetical protein HYW22_01275 [Candidatus Aenigmarchaeota archaeon]|nr:hypothetical protein [Candidatus Aenigmarchaeota archaeon]
MRTKLQKHHYETGSKTNLIAFLIACAVFFLIMFYFVNIRNQPFNLAFANRAIAIDAVFFIGMSYLLGPLAGLFPKIFVSKLEYRKSFGLSGYAAAISHILISLLIVPGSVFESNGLSLFFAMIAILIFTLVSSTSLVKIESFGFEKWQKIQRLGYIAFILVILHFVLLENGQFIGRQLGQITLAFALLVLLARIVVMIFKK